MVWWIWFGVSIVIGIVELSSFTFVLLWIAIAGFITSLLSTFVHGLTVQILVFAALSVLLVLATRPVARKWRAQRTLTSRDDALLNAAGVVVSNESSNKYAIVRVQGNLWSAVSTASLQVGQTVRVVKSSTTILTVEPIEEG